MLIANKVHANIGVRRHTHTQAVGEIEVSKKARSPHHYQHYTTPVARPIGVQKEIISSRQRCHKQNDILLKQLYIKRRAGQ